MTNSDITAIDAEIALEIGEATEFAEASPLPSGDECFTHLWAD